MRRKTLSSNGTTKTSPSSQIDKFKEAARQLDTDDDPEHFKDRLKKLVRHKPVEKPE